MVTIPPGFITLLDAFAKAGPEVLPAWNDDVLNPHLWVRNDSQGLAHWRWFEVAGWLEHEINSGTLTLWFLNAAGKAERVKGYIGARDGASFLLTGRLTSMTRQESLEWLATDRQSDEPLLLVEDAALRAAIATHLQPDDSEDWSFAALLAWICWRRYDMVREHSAYSCEFIFQELRTHYSNGQGVVLSGPHALRDLWDNLSKGKIVATGLPSGENTRREEIPSREWQDYDFNSKGTADVLASKRDRTVIYSSPSVRRQDAERVWAPLGATQSKNSDTAPQKRRPKSGELEKDYLAYKQKLARDPSRDEARVWRQTLPYYVTQDRVEAMRTRHLAGSLQSGPKPKREQSI